MQPYRDIRYGSLTRSPMAMSSHASSDGRSAYIAVCMRTAQGASPRILHLDKAVQFAVLAFENRVVGVHILKQQNRREAGFVVLFQGLCRRILFFWHWRFRWHCRCVCRHRFTWIHTWIAYRICFFTKHLCFVYEAGKPPLYAKMRLMSPELSKRGQIC
jgi:hypothetical protein